MSPSRVNLHPSQIGILLGIGENPKSHGAKGDGVSNESVAFTTAINTGKKNFVITPGTYRLSANVTFPADSQFIVMRGAIIKPDNGITVTFGSILGAEDYQIFDDTAGGIFKTTSRVARPDWWGDIQGAVKKAIDSLPNDGGTVKLNDKIYKPNGYEYGFGSADTNKYISKPNVKIRGSKMPVLSTDCKSLVNGTIIQGMVLGYADHIEVENLGVDCGYNVIQQYYGGTVTPGIHEGLLLTYPNDASKTASELRTGAKFHNVIALANSPSDSVHAFILGEGYQNVVTTGDVVGCFGIHGIVIKCKDVKAEQLTAYGNNNNGVIIKSDSQATAKVSRVQIGRIATYENAPGTPYAMASQTYGVLFNAAGGDIDIVAIGSIYAEGATNGVATLLNGSYSLSNLQIGQITTETTSNGVSLVAGTGIISRTQLGQVVCRNAVDGLTCDWADNGASGVNVDSLTAVNCSGVALATNRSPVIHIDKIVADNCTEAMYRLVNGTKLKVGMAKKLTGTTTDLSTVSGGVAPALANGWTNVASNAPFGLDFEGGGIRFRGLVIPGTTPTIAALLPSYARPVYAKRFIVQGRDNAGAIVAVPLVVGADGVLIINEVAGGYTNAAQWLSLDGVAYSLIG